MKITNFSKEEALVIIQKKYPYLFTDVKNRIKKEKNRIKKEKKRSERASAMIELKKEGLTLQEISNKFGITRERVRQILFKEGITAKQYPYAKKKIQMQERICPKCKNCFSFPETEKKKYCSMKCFHTDNMFNKPRREWTPEEVRTFDKKRNHIPKAIKARRIYFEANKEKIYKKNLEYARLPEVKERKKELHRLMMLDPIKAEACRKKQREKSKIYYYSQKGKKYREGKNKS